MRRDRLSWLMLLALVAGLIGCGETPQPEPASDVEPEPVLEAGTEPEQQAETLVPALPAETATVPELASELAPEASSDGSDEPRTVLGNSASQVIDTERESAAHRIAGRSAFPALDEEVTQLIPAKRLSDEDPFAEPVEPTDIPDLVPWTDAKRYVGYEITVEGTIVDVGQSRDGSVNFLNFHRDWRGKFYMVVFDDLAKTLPKSVDATFRGKKLHVTGEVEEHRGRPQIRILAMDQVKFVE